MLIFKEKEKTMVYDFNSLCGQQIIIAEQAFMIHYERLEKLPKNSTELNAFLTTNNALFKAFGVLLNEMTPDGNILSYDPERHTGGSFVRKMSAKNMVKMFNGETLEGGEKVTGVMDDFFSSIGHFSPESIRTLKTLALMNQSEQLSEIQKSMNQSDVKTELTDSGNEA